DLERICQLTIDHPDLESYYHPETPGRKPLVVSDYLIGKKLSLIKFEEPVTIVSNTKLKGKAFFRFKDIVVTPPTATVKFEYPIEGVTGELEFMKGGSGIWQITKTTLNEK